MPPSPDAAGLGKYGSTPVGLHTGIPSISIPLYTVRSGSLELPISISYHAAGIKVNEIASWVGLGWSLNAGGVVTRSVVGKSDEGGFWNMTVKNASQLSSSDYIYMKGIADGGDGESDFYFFNFNERSGKFIYQQNNATPFQIPQSPLKIGYVGSQFEIFDEVGNKYIFGQVETTQLNDGSMETFKSAFYLTQIVAANGVDNIQLTYELDNGYFEGSTMDVETIGPRATQPGGGGVTIINDHQITTNTSSRFILPVRLKEITFATGKVKFERVTGRLDLTNNARLSEIQIFDRNSDGTYASQPKKKITFITNYFGSTIYDYRLKLQEVVEKDEQSTTIRKHSFSYDETVSLPARTSSRAQDWWGFYNGQNSNTSLIQPETISVSGIPYTVGGGNRSPSATHMISGTLNKIIYPTGGYTEFVYEPHYYPEEGTGITKMAGGLRVKTVKDYTSATATPIIKEYRYGTAESGKGILLIPSYGINSSKRDIDWVFNASGPDGICSVYAGYSGTRKVISGTAPVDLTSLNGAPVVYPEVTVYESSTSAPNGKQVHQFNAIVDQFTLADKAYNNGSYQLNNSWQGGDELWNGAYTSGNVKVSEKVSTQSIFNSTQTTGTKIGYRIQMDGCTVQPGLSASILFSHLYYFDYPTYSGVKKPTLSKEIRISQADATKKVELSEEYFYDNLQSNHQQVTRKITLDSDGDQVLTKYWYPADYLGTTTIGSTTIQTLLDANIIGKPIKTEKSRGTPITEGDVQTYNQYGDLIEIYRLESGTPPTHQNNA